MATTNGRGETSSDLRDRIHTPLNACSLEVLHEQCRRYPESDADGGAEGGAWPLVVGCYQLNEARGVVDNDKPDDDDATSIETGANTDLTSPQADVTPTRSGELRLYSVPLQCNGAPPALGDPSQVVHMDSGVLDAKWHWVQASASSGESEENCLPYLASACASGRIHVHKLVDDDSEPGPGASHRKLIHAGASDSDESGATRLCLSLDWDRRSGNDAVPLSQRIVSSYSDGSLSVHTFQSIPANGQESTSFVQPLLETERWEAHKLFGCPSEVWTCCFASSYAAGTLCSGEGTKAILSGGDDCVLKLWDCRILSAPMEKVGNREFDAGVTALSYHPSLEHAFAVGSYDEVVRLYDVRKLGEPMCRVQVGGGVWRLRWHPQKVGRILVAAMHGGCRIVNFGGLGSGEEEGSATAGIEAEFTEHEPMAYGADWLVSGPTEHAASCSFYDRQVCLWKSVAAV